MTLETDEPEIQMGTRAWAVSQSLFQGAIDPTRSRYDVQCGWYDTAVDDNVGAFCLIQTGSALEELVGDVLRIEYGTRHIFVYCIGGADIDTPIALARYPMLNLADLSHDYIDVVVQPTA